MTLRGDAERVARNRSLPDLLAGSRIDPADNPLSFPFPVSEKDLKRHERRAGRPYWECRIRSVMLRADNRACNRTLRQSSATTPLQTSSRRRRAPGARGRAGRERAHQALQVPSNIYEYLR